MVSCEYDVNLRYCSDLVNRVDNARRSMQLARSLPLRKQMSSLSCHETSSLLFLRPACTHVLFVANEVAVRNEVVPTLLARGSRGPAEYSRVIARIPRVES